VYVLLLKTTCNITGGYQSFGDTPFLPLPWSAQSKLSEQRPFAWCEYQI